MDSFDPALISVVMPCYNMSSYVHEAITSVLQQSYASVELIVVNDGSSDGSTEIIQDLAQAHPDRIRLLYQNRAGPYAARNQGLALAQGNFVAFLDADDYWHPDTLSALHAALTESRADLAYCGWQNVGADAENLQPYVPPAIEDHTALLHILKACPWPINGVLIRRQLLDSLRGFSERRATAMDYDLWLRMLAHKPHFVRVPEVLAFYRHYSRDDATIPRWRQVIDAVAVRKDFVRRNPELIAAFSQAHLNRLIYGTLLSEAYRCHWRRDTESSRRLFIHAFFKADWKMGDLKYLLASFMPAALFEGLIRVIDARRNSRAL